MTPKAQVTKEKLENIKIKNLCLKGHSRVKRQTVEWEKSLEMKLISRIYKGPQKLNHKKINNPEGLGDLEK